MAYNGCMPNLEENLATARSWHGLGWTPANVRQTFLNTVYPNDTPAAQADLGSHQQCCALVGQRYAALFRDHPTLHQPIATRVGKAVSDLLDILRSWGVLLEYTNPSHRALLLETPEPGDIVMIGGSGHGVEHFDIVTTLLSAEDKIGYTEGQQTLWALAGGQLSGPYIREVERRVVPFDKMLWFCDASQPMVGGYPRGRPMMARARMSQLT